MFAALGKIDVDARRALSEQNRIGDDLRKKMKSVHEDLDEESDEDNGDKDLISEARAILQETSNDEDAANEARSGVFKLAFMQRGLQRQRER